MTPKPTPTPIPIAAPVGRPEDPAAAELPADSPLVAPAVVGLPEDSRLDDRFELDAVVADGEIEDVDNVEDDIEDAVEEDAVDDHDDDDDVSGVAGAMFHPTTAMAPTVELALSVVVTIDQAFESPSGVDAKVSTAPEVTSDRQSPPTDPCMPCAR
jgi:hypothetical protein